MHLKYLVKHALEKCHKISIQLTAKGASLTEMGIEKFAGLPDELVLAVTDEEVSRIRFTPKQFVINAS
ncbi:MAG: hypothetical protein AB8B89_01910 [Gammaproteobacteria bacterium]